MFGAWLGPFKGFRVLGLGGIVAEGSGLGEALRPARKGLCGFLVCSAVEAWRLGPASLCLMSLISSTFRFKSLATPRP